MTDLTSILRRNMIRHLVQKTIFCPTTGQILDVRTCVVVNDRDGDPHAVLSPEGWASISDENKTLLHSLGVTVTTN